MMCQFISISNAFIKCCVYKWIRDEYRYLCSLIGIPSFLIVVTWIWKNNESGLSWWCNQLASFILFFVYIFIFFKLNWKMVNVVFHCFIITSIISHMLLPLLDKDIIEICCMMLNEKGGLFQLWSSSPYWWVTVRDGPLILSSISTVIALIYSLYWQRQLSDSTLYIPIDEPLLGVIPQTSISTRRWRHRTFRKFRCALIRFVVFGINHNRRRRRDRYRRSHRVT